MVERKALPTNLTREQAKAILQDFTPELLAEVLAEKLGANPLLHTRNRSWLNTDPAWQGLGLKSAEQLRRLRRKGIFRHGTEYRIVENEYQFHVERCEARLKELPQEQLIAANRPRVSRGKKSKAALVTNLRDQTCRA